MGFPGGYGAIIGFDHLSMIFLKPLYAFHKINVLDVDDQIDGVEILIALETSAQIFIPQDRRLKAAAQRAGKSKTIFTSVAGDG